MEAFAMATLGNAELLGLDSLIGNLAKGKADLVLLKPKPKASWLGGSVSALSKRIVCLHDHGGRNISCRNHR